MLRTLLVSLAMVAAGRAACTSPGHERWDIKVSLPADSAIAKSKSVELASLVKLPNPPNAKNKDKDFESARIPSFSNPLNLAEGDLVNRVQLPESAGLETAFAARLRASVLLQMSVVEE